MTLYARGTNAIGFCERCQFRVRLSELQDQVVATKPSGLLVCSDCLDVDHPQLMLGRYRVFDPQTLRRPAPPVEYEIEAPLNAYGRQLGISFVSGFSRLSRPPDGNELDFNFYLDESELG